MIKSIVFNIISKHSGIPTKNIKIATSLQEDLMISDLIFNDIITAIESRFNLKIPLSAIDQFYSVYDIVDYVKKHSPISDS